jgi:hypothetical protein
MLSGNKKWFYLLPLIVLVCVPIRIRGIDKTFWIFSFDFKSLGEKGIIWHCYALMRSLNWQYFFCELIIAYLVFWGGIYFLKFIRGSRAKNF